MSFSIYPAPAGVAYYSSVVPQQTTTQTTFTTTLNIPAGVYLVTRGFQAVNVTESNGSVPNFFITSTVSTASTRSAYFAGPVTVHHNVTLSYPYVDYPASDSTGTIALGAINNVNMIGNQIWIAASGGLQVSTNMTTWTFVSRTALSTDQSTFFSIIGDGSGVLTVGMPSSGNQVVHSTNSGATWIQGTHPTPASGWNKYAAAFGGNQPTNRYMFGGDAGQTILSSNAVTWTTGTWGDSNTINGLTYDGTMYVAAGTGGRIRWTNNGTSWNGTILGNSSYGAIGVALAATPNKYVAVGSTVSAISTNGVNWTSYDSPWGNPEPGWVGHFNNLWWTSYNQGSMGLQGQQLLYSTNGVTWTFQQTANGPVTSGRYQGSATLAGVTYVFHNNNINNFWRRAVTITTSTANYVAIPSFVAFERIG